MVQKAPGGWERNTMRKATQALAALDRNLGRKVIFLDVDCDVRRPLNVFDSMNADVSVLLKFKTTVKARSGTMILNQTDNCRSFLKHWRDLSGDATVGMVDQQTLVPALFKVPGLSIQTLDVSYCAVPQDNLDHPAILHDSASLGTAKVPSWQKRLYELVGVRPKDEVAWAS
jgi:hypothetical protein